MVNYYLDEFHTYTYEEMVELIVSLRQINTELKDRIEGLQDDIYYWQDLAKNYLEVW